MNKINGGKAVDSGGFGCVFLPSLKCANSTSLQNKSFISKLMPNNYAEEEYNLIQKFNVKLKSIPNYSNYFLLNNFEICHPSQLMSEDLINYETECTELIDKGINKSNINSKLNEIKTLNMPFGGINIRKFIKNNFKVFIKSEILKVNQSNFLIF